MIKKYKQKNIYNDNCVNEKIQSLVKDGAKPEDAVKIAIEWCKINKKTTTK